MGFKKCVACSYEWNPRKRFTCLQCGKALVSPGAMVPKPAKGGGKSSAWPWHHGDAGQPDSPKGNGVGPEKGKGKGKGAKGAKGGGKGGWKGGYGYGKGGVPSDQIPDPVAMCESLRSAMENMPGMDVEKLKVLDGVMETAKHCKQSMEELRKPEVDPATAEARKHFEQMRKSGFFKDDPQLLDTMRAKLGLDVVESAEHSDKPIANIANVVWNLEQKLARKEKACVTADAAVVDCESAVEAARIAFETARDSAIERKLSLGEVQKKLAEARETAVQQNLMSAVAQSLPMVPGSVVTGGLPGMSAAFLALPGTQKDLGDLQRLVKGMYDKQAAENKERDTAQAAVVPGDADDDFLNDIGDEEFGQLDNLEPAAKRKKIAELVRNSQNHKRSREGKVDSTASTPNADEPMGGTDGAPPPAAGVASPGAASDGDAAGAASATWAAEAANNAMDAVNAGKNAGKSGNGAPSV